LLAKNNEEKIVLKNAIIAFTIAKGVVLYEKLIRVGINITLKLEKNERDSRKGDT